MPKQAETDHLPVHTIRHRRLKVAIWHNATTKGSMYNVTIVRSYRDPETNEWRDSQSLGYDDIMNVVSLLQQAHTYITGLHAKEAAAGKAPVRRAAASSRAPSRPVVRNLPTDGSQ